MVTEDVRTDMFGNVVEIGDEVAFNPPYYKGLCSGKILKFTPQGYRVSHTDYSKYTIVYQVAKNTNKETQLNDE